MLIVFGRVPVEDRIGRQRILAAAVVQEDVAVAVVIAVETVAQILVLSRQTVVAVRLHHDGVDRRTGHLQIADGVFVRGIQRLVLGQHVRQILRTAVIHLQVTQQGTRIACVVRVDLCLVRRERHILHDGLLLLLENVADRQRDKHDKDDQRDSTEHKHRCV